MPVLRDSAVVAAVLLALLFASDALFGAGEPRFDAVLYDSAFYAPRAEEFRFAPNAAPAERVNEVFAQFVPSEGKRVKRYSSLPTIIR
jgi:hypothetical protein